MSDNCTYCGVDDGGPHADDCINYRKGVEERFEETKAEILPILHAVGNAIANALTPRAGAWCSFCNEAKPTDLDVIKTSTGTAICRACIELAAGVFAEREKLR